LACAALVRIPAPGLSHAPAPAHDAASPLPLAALPQIGAGLRGCVVFTSSAAAAIPSPFSVQYAATKSFISVFGASLAPEVKPYGIDVLVFHPSPVASRCGGGGRGGAGTAQQGRAGVACVLRQEQR
jgi:short-subunit dehydrogenase